MTYKTLTGTKPLCIMFNKVEDLFEIWMELII